MGLNIASFLVEFVFKDDSYFKTVIVFETVIKNQTMCFLLIIAKSRISFLYLLAPSRDNHKTQLSKICYIEINENYI